MHLEPRIVKWIFASRETTNHFIGQLPVKVTNLGDPCLLSFYCENNKVSFGKGQPVLSSQILPHTLHVIFLFDHSSGIGHHHWFGMLVLLCKNKANKLGIP